MRRIHRIMAVLLLTCLLSTLGLSVHAGAAELSPLFRYGWEHWKVRSYQDKLGVWQYAMTCPTDNISMDALIDHVLGIMAYCRAANPSPTSVTIHFRFTEGLSELSARAAQATGMTTGVRTVTSALLNLSSSRIRTEDTHHEILLVLDVNNPHSASPYSREVPFGTAMDAVHELAADIAAKTDKPREQIRLINEYLVQTVDYGFTEDERRAYSIVGALADGKAICAGYTNAVSSLCHVLGIPYYQLDDRKNNHTWNVVQIDGQWLMLDVTYNASGIETTEYLLSEGFADAHHDYREENLRLLESYAARLSGAQAAAERLGNVGIVLGSMDDDAALTQPLTYPELAYMLTLLDGADVSVLPKANIENCPDWAMPYVSYCVNAGYFSGLDVYRLGDYPHIDAARQMLLDCHANSAQAQSVLPQEKWTANGTTLLRGTFFEMVGALR